MSRLVLTVFFDDPFWAGVVEVQEGEQLRAARYVFGAEPSAGEVLAFVQHKLGKLLDGTSVMVAAAPILPRPPHPKRAARMAAREITQRGASTQSQAALRLQIEQHKQASRQRSKAEREAEEDYKRQIKIAKAKARRRGH